MRNILFLALRYLRFNQAKTSILVFSVAVALFLPLAVNLLVRDYQRNLLARASATPLIAGAPGSKLELALHALYFRGKPEHNVTMGDATSINNSQLALGIPILEKYTAQGFSIVGTSLEYFNFRGLHVAQGDGLARVADCLLGATVAAKLGLKPGDKLMSDPENVFDLAGSYPVNMHVTGILAPTGTADDGAIFTDYKTCWIIAGLMHGHGDVAAMLASHPVYRYAARRYGWSLEEGGFRTEYYPMSGFRLPTEAEWKYAAMGGDVSPLRFSVGTLHSRTGSI